MWRVPPPQATAITCAASCWPTARVRSSAPSSAPPFPPAVYVGHPGWKAAGGRTGYSMATGVVIALLCFFGMFGLLGTIFPTAAIVPILLYIGLLIGAQAFQATPRAHAGAVVAAFIPNMAAWATRQVDNGRAPADTRGPCPARARRVDSEHRSLGHRADGQRARRGRHQRNGSGDRHAGR